MRYFLTLAVFLTLFGCSDRPRNAVDGVLDVAVSTKFDPMHGIKSKHYIGVLLNGDLLPLSIAEDAEIVNLNGRDLLFLSGTDIVLDGEVRDGIYYARYVKFLD